MSELKLEAILNHPKFIDGKKLEHCEDRIATRAFLVYLNLSETHGWCEAEMLFSAQLNTVYITGKVKEEDQHNTVVFPVDAQTNTDCEFLRTAMETLCAENEGFIIAVCETDSTIVYYRIKTGLHPPKCLQEYEKPEADEGSNVSESTDEDIETTYQEEL